MFLSLLSFVLNQCFAFAAGFPREKAVYINLVVLSIEVFILLGFCMSIVRFFNDFMALDNCPSLAISEEDKHLDNDMDDDMNDDVQDDMNDDMQVDVNDDEQDCEEDEISASEDVSSSACVETPHLPSQKTQEAIKINEIISTLEKDLEEKVRIVDELRKKVEGLTEEGTKLEQNITDLERLSHEKDRQLLSMPAEMEELRREIALKAQETEKFRRENEDKNSSIIILENTVAVLNMEKETLRQDLQQKENSLSELKNELDKKNEDMKKLREENRRKQNSIESLQKETEDQNLRMNCLEDQLQVLTVEKKLAQENLKQLELCRKELADKKRELEDVKAHNLQRDREILHLENELSQKQREVLSSMKGTKSIIAQRANGKINEMTRRTVQLEFEHAEMKEELETMEFEKMEAILELEKLQEEALAQDMKIISLDMKGLDMISKANDTFYKEKTVTKMAPKKQPGSEMKVGKESSQDKPRCLRKPKVNCKALYRQMDDIEEGIHQIRSSQRLSTANRRLSKALAKLPSVTKPLNRDQIHQRLRMESAANLRRLERDAAMVRNLYKGNYVT
ncbi:coiled-coil domain-containing protein 39-like [Macrobrachium nipponense]|uniref:coiled-coil domain-containing protein 39-like n=1 Tax=Macrobrachium nipponense TaxID=159736 RepID=UPI0030C7C417